MEIPSLTAAIRRELLAHPEVTEGKHPFGGIVFHLGRHELGHVHGETVADLPFPPHIRDELVASGRISADHLVSDSDWVSWRVNAAEDVAQIVELFQISYEHAARQAVEGAEEEDQPAVPDAASRHKATLRDVLALPLRSFRQRRRRR